MASGFDDIFAELTNINAEQVLLSERVKLLEEQLEAGQSGSGDADGEQERPVGAPVRWNDLEPEERAVLWPQFVRWVIWVADRYEMTTDQLPRQCWWKHGAVVEELTALWTSRESAYAGGEDGGSAPYLWQDALARAVERMGRFWLGACRNGQHRARHRDATWDGDADYLALLLAAEGPEPDGDASDPRGDDQPDPDEDGSG
ncbi:hypothetical protein EDD90_2020 [Streptomyces sp. Ag109_O5-1]|uniref:hypothetical protein n=1 Tax=Streptomyces sp. Ag109_O5-1 TaxID=1938851 RepID=UPI000F4D8FCE|nr:hypothetical protein [Streptomyces sp. Ag109_O5-1]RPE39064.1 hypothetical protein EDD90_2020 [Streptomyces sp. Ag109_O5-1]